MNVATDPDLADLVTACGHRIADAGAPDVDAVALVGPGAWGRVRELRAAGQRAGCVVIVGEDAERDGVPDRSALEPVMVVRTPAGLQRALIGVAGARTSTGVLAGGSLDADSRRFVDRAGAEIGLTELETRLLAYLACRPGRSVDRDELQEQVWDHRRAVPSKAVDMAIARLRRKIEPLPSNPVTLLTVRNGGYCVGLPAETVPAAPATRLFAREGVITELVRRLSGRGFVAVALVGPPGVGKTSVLREVAYRLAFAGVGVAWLDLDLLPTDVDPAVAVATALDLDIPADGDGWPCIVQALRGRVVAVDHGEQRPDVVSSVVSALADQVPLLLATQVAPETAAVEVRLLPVLGDEDATELIMERVDGSVVREGVRRVVAQLDGLPLALVLAARQIAILGADGFEEALDHRLRMLSPPGADRHGSLRVAVAHALERLAPGHRALLSSMLVFQGPFALSDVRAVLGDDAVGEVSALVSSGVLVRDGARFRLLHAMRGDLGPVGDAVRDRHLGWAVSQVTLHHRRLGGWSSRESFGALITIQADAWAGLAHALATGAASEAVELAIGLDAVLGVTGTSAERVALLARIERIAHTERRAAALAGWVSVRVTLQTRAADALENAALSKRVAEALAPWDPELAARALFMGLHHLLDQRPLEVLEQVLGFAWPRERQGRARALEALARSAIGETTVAEAAATLEACTEDLIAHGMVLDAVYVGRNLVNYRTEIGAPSIPWCERIVEWSSSLREPTISLHARLKLAERYAADHRLDEARELVTAVETEFTQIAPASLLDSGQVLAGIELDLGELDAARSRLMGLVGRAALAGRIQVQTVSRIRLVYVEIEAGRLTEARMQALEGVAAGERSGHLLQLATARECLAMVLLLAGELEECERVWSTAAALRPLSAAWCTLGIVLAARWGRSASELESELVRLVARPPPGANADAVRAVTSAGRRGDQGALSRARDEVGTVAMDARLLARIWLAA